MRMPRRIVATATSAVALAAMVLLGPGGISPANGIGASASELGILDEGEVSLSSNWGPIGTQVQVVGQCDAGDEPSVELQHLYGPPEGEMYHRYPLVAQDVTIDAEGAVAATVEIPEVYTAQNTNLGFDFIVPLLSGYQFAGAVSCDGEGWERSEQRFTIEAAPFVGVPEGHPFHQEIAWMGDDGVSTGYGDGEFGGTMPVTRQAMVAFIYRFAGSDPVPSVVNPSRFPDVPLSHPFSRPIWWAVAGMTFYGYEVPVTEGYEDDTFRPNQDVTRQAASAFLYRLAGEPEVDLPEAPTFTDVPTDHPFYLAIEWAASEGIVEGFENGTFRPQVVVTRQAAAAFLFRYAAMTPA